MTRFPIIFGIVGTTFISCQPPKAEVEPSIEFTRLPPSGDGSPDKIHPIEGRVKGGSAGQHIVLFARSGIWWIQPIADHPFTEIQGGDTWKSTTHPGSAYAALLVKPGYRTTATLSTLPEKGGGVLAVSIAEGAMLSLPVAKTLAFSGYEWQVREVASDRGGTRNYYDAANAWIDKSGFLHLRIGRKGDDWTSAEINLTRSLGYGSYRFAVRDVSRLEPAAVFSVFTWDDAGPPREMDIEIGRWGEPDSKNAQYVVQPYYVPANAFRFSAPDGMLTYLLRWEPGRAAFKTFRGSIHGNEHDIVAEHAFSSGIPSPGKESIHMNLYVFDNKRNPLRHECEVVVEKFEYLP